MRIFIVSRIFFSGQTTHVVELAIEASRQGHQVAVVVQGRCHTQAWEAYRPLLQSDGVQAMNVQDHHDLEKVWHEFDPDIVHVHSSDLIAWACEYGASMHVPVIVTCHGLGVAEKSPHIKRADHVIAVGPNVRADLMKNGVTRVTLIQNGVDTDRFRPAIKPRDLRTPLKIAYVGRVDVTKRRGLSALIEAVTLVPGAHLTIASNEYYHHPRVTSVGWLANVAPLMAESHVVIGTGRAIREGMSSGCVGVVLGQTYGGVVTPESLVAQPKGSTSFSGLHGQPPISTKLRRDLVKLIQNDARRRSLGRWGRAIALRHFSLKEMTRRVVSLYQDACSQTYDGTSRKVQSSR